MKLKLILTLALITLTLTACGNTADMQTVTTEPVTTTTSTTTTTTSPTTTTVSTTEPVTTTTEQTTTKTTTSKTTTTTAPATTVAPVTTTAPKTTTKVTTKATTKATTTAPKTTTPKTTTTTKKATTTQKASTTSKLDLAYQALVKGTSTAKQRELVRQDLIAYGIKTNGAELDESKFAFKDINGNETNDASIAYLMINEYSAGIATEVWTTMIYFPQIMGKQFGWEDMKANSVEILEVATAEYKRRLFEEVKGYPTNRPFNIIFYHDYNESNTGKSLPDWVMIYVM